MSANNYKVSGRKMTSRFGMSHSDQRVATKFHAQFYSRDDEPKTKLPMSKRLAKKCKHTRWEDTSYGGPESGAMGGYCKDCGYSMHVQLY